jgi:PAS domain S-box-containing protein
MITEHNGANEALANLVAHSEQQRRFYEAILSSTPDLVYAFDLNHRFTYANEALLRMWGKTAEEAIGKNCLELGYEPWHAAMHDREIEQVIATKQSIRGDVPFSGTQGRRVYDYIFVPVFGVNGEVEAVAGTTRDVTERYLTEQELRRANQDLEQFAYAATHDLQEPLRSVKIYSELLEQRYATGLEGKALDCLKFLRSGAMRMEMLIRDLLSYTQAGRLEAPVEMTDANACLELALSNLAAAIAESDAKLSYSSLPSVKIYHAHLQQIFQNLIGNSIKYRRPDVAPVIHISVVREGSHWRFTVADNGIGIQEQYKDLIFGLFKRLHTGDKYSGTGIGLALCQRIVERNHGRIWVESQLGKGSQFHFTVPA